jgi:adenylyltransferase/sulfurtransferase
VGLQGQRKLKAASVLIIGTGGLGSPVALYLAAAGVGRIGLVDFDVVDASNLQRQIIHGSGTLGDLKVESAKKRLLDLNPDIRVDAHNEMFSAENAFRIAEPYDIIVDCSDNFPTRYLSNDLAVLTGKPNVYGSIFRFDGQVSVFDASRGPCYRCIFPEPPPPGAVPTCAEGGVLGILPGTIGTLQATEVVKLILGVGEPLIGTLLLYDALEMRFDRIKLRKNPQCKVCGEHPEITGLMDYEAFCGFGREPDALGEEWEITPAELADRLKRGDSLKLVDVREPHEAEIARIPGAESIPLGQLTSRIAELNPDEEIVLICKEGTRSARALKVLREAGFRKARNLKGGINAWAQAVEPSLPVY